LDKNRLGSQFSNNWYREIALSAGVGFRMDLDFFILRLDLGIPITNPSMPIGERWVFNRERPNYISEGINTFGLDKYQKYLPKPFTPVFHFGIGFPF
jgi:outer membrane protein assembly factor BamA